MSLAAEDYASCRLLLVTETNLLDAAFESHSDRELLCGLAGLGLACEAVGRFADGDRDTDPRAWLEERGWAEAPEGFAVPDDLERPVRAAPDGVPVTLYRAHKSQPNAPEGTEREQFLRLVDAAMTAHRPGVVLVRPGPAQGDVLAAARERGIAAVAFQPDCLVRDPAPLQSANLVLTPTAFAATYLREAFGLPCVHLPPVVPVIAHPGAGASAVLFDATAPGGGLKEFAQIADALGQRRAGLSVVIIGGNGSMEMPGGGTVRCLPPTEAATAWELARVCVAPTVGWEHLPRAGLTALTCGVPVVASDRGAGSELFGAAGTVVPLPDRLTTAFSTRFTPAELKSWVDATLKIYDDATHAARQRELATAAGQRLGAEALAPQYAELLVPLARSTPVTGARPFTANGSANGHADAAKPTGRAKSVVLVPHLNGIEWECEQALRQLEHAGVKVVRRGGCSAIDSARNELLSDALHDGAESMLFIDSDIGFDPADALRLLARPEPVAIGIYPKKGPRELASIFADGVKELLFGPDATGAYPLKYAATGFLRVKAPVLRRMVTELQLPLCNTHWGRGVWPFCQPLVIPHGTGKWHYLGEDWAFSHRLSQIGVTPVADTSIRLWHWGRYSFGWEDAGRAVARYRSYSYRLSGT